MSTTIKSLQAIVKNNAVVLRLRMKNGIEAFMQMPTHTLNSASVVAETMKRDASRFSDENIILLQFS